MRSDEVLWLRYLEGDESGLVGLMEQYGSSLTFYINAYLHDVSDAEDLMIEAFAYLFLLAKEYCQSWWMRKSSFWK